ncbi:MAG: DUF3883 domain-containing protein [Candidatus Delongbacteria bacterium]|jgi:hypothetical protein|nr:DUF3883 domain-containing protein [Candidatus Delongbacteria bacterium]
MNKQELRVKQSRFLNNKEMKKDIKYLVGLRNKFVKKFSTSKILNLSLDEYVVGKGSKDSFCYWVENKLNELGNIQGSTAGKFGVYFGYKGEKSKQKYRIGKMIFGSEHNEAFENVKLAIKQLIENPDDIEILKKNPISPMFKGKILALYHPEKFINVYYYKHLDFFIIAFGLTTRSRSETEKNKLLLKYKNSDGVMKSWTNFEFAKFLYTYVGKPDTGLIKEEFDEKELTPIEKVKFEFVNLELIEMDDIETEKKSTKPKKPDYEKQAKKYKKIGERGEQIVMLAETEYLKKKGKVELAENVEQKSKEDDSLGYDILSFNLDKSVKYIEVKSTQRKIGQSDVFITKNELDTLKDNKNYFIYVVYEVLEKRPKIWKICGMDLKNDGNVIITPVSYKMTFKTREK